MLPHVTFGNYLLKHLLLLLPHVIIGIIVVAAIVPDRWPQSLLFKMTSGLDMLQLFQPGVAIMAQQMLSNETLMQVRWGAGRGGEKGVERGRTAGGGGREGSCLHLKGEGTWSSRVGEGVVGVFGGGLEGVNQEGAQRRG